jgi:uncharacterized protein involved in outer membrane biogenesis
MIGASVAKRATAFRQHGSLARAGLWLLVAIAVLAGLIFGGLTWGPNLMRHQIAAKVGESVGREVSIGRIEVSPLLGRIIITDLVVMRPPAPRPTVAVKRLTVDVSPLAYLKGRVVVRDVQIEDVKARIVRHAPVGFDISDIIERIQQRPASDGKLEWELDRVSIDRGAFEFDDQYVGKVTQISDLSLTLHDLSNRDDRRSAPAKLDVSLNLDGHPFSLNAVSTPFADSRVLKGHATLADLPLVSFLPYLNLPDDIRPRSGTLGFKLGVTLNADSPELISLLEIQGKVGVGEFSLIDGTGHERVSVASLAFALEPSKPLGGALHASSITLDRPRLSLGRRADGKLLWPAPLAVGKPGHDAQKTAKATQVSGPKSLQIDSLRITGGQIDWQDAALPAPLTLRLEQLAVSADAITIPDLAKPAVANGKVHVEARLDDAAPLNAQLNAQLSAPPSAQLSADLSLDGQRGHADVSLQDLSLPHFAPLAGPGLKAKLESGRLDAKATLNWDSAAPSWSMTDGLITLSDLKLSHANQPPATIGKLTIRDVSADPVVRHLELGSVVLERSNLSVRRASNGRFNLQDWYVPPAASAALETTARPATSANSATPSAAAPWTLLAKSVEIDRLELDYADSLIDRERRLPRLTLNAKASSVTLDPSKSASFDATATLIDGARLSARGTVRPVPLDVDAQVQVRRASLTYVDPYVEPYLNLTIARGQLWSTGRLRLSSTPGGELSRIGFNGEVSFNEFSALDKVSSDDFLRWSALVTPSVKVDWRPARPGDSLIEVGDVAVVDFYARVILSPAGRLNLRDIVVDRKNDAAPISLTTVQPDPNKPADGSEAAEAVATTTLPTTALSTKTNVKTPASAAPASPQPTLRIGTIRIGGGNINFTDNFIKPNYTANLTQLNGSIDAIASDRSEPSEVNVSGRVDDDAPLEITGQFHPLPPNRLIDLRAVARGFDLPKISPYSGRWAGYSIEKGKLSADVRYRIDGDTLQASNKLVINQLTFGPKVDSPSASKLPVLLAVSLLKDRNGNIDLDIPISGSLSDPQFSVGSLIWKVIGNLIVKVVTSPFSFLASLGGGAANDISYIEFAPGNSTLDEEDRKRLDSLAKGLTERPAVSLEIAGYGDEAGDRIGMQQARLEQTLRALKFAELRRANRSAELPSIDAIMIDPAERPALLERAWRNAKLNPSMFGKPPPPEALEAQLLEHEVVTSADVKQVAQLRAQTARDYLRDRKAISHDRLYLMAPRLPGPDDKLPPARVSFEVK